MNEGCRQPLDGVRCIYYFYSIIFFKAYSVEVVLGMLSLLHSSHRNCMYACISGWQCVCLCAQASPSKKRLHSVICWIYATTVHYLLARGLCTLIPSESPRTRMALLMSAPSSQMSFSIRHISHRRLR